MSNGTLGVAAVVVTYFPDSGLRERLAELLPQVGFLIVVDNTPLGQSDSSVEALVPADEGVCLLRNAANRGVAAALNQGLEAARARGFLWLLTMDQDSRSDPDLVRTLCRIRDLCVPTPRVVGANYRDLRNGRTKVRDGAVEDALEQKTVITSGSLVDVEFAFAIGGFRDDFFIDQLDHEFCLRVRARGGRVVIGRRPVMNHSVGEAGGAWLPGLGFLPNHSPLRKYYMVRNSLVTVAAYWRSEPDWCFRRMVRLVCGICMIPFVEDRRWMKLRAALAGVTDAWKGVLGPCGHAWLSRS